MPKVHAIETASGRLVMIPSRSHVGSLRGHFLHDACVSHDAFATSDVIVADPGQQAARASVCRHPVILDCRCVPPDAVLASPHLGKPDAGARTSTPRAAERA